MNREQFTHARHVARTFVTYATCVIDQIAVGDTSLSQHCARWMSDVYEPLLREVNLPEIYAATCVGSDSGAFGPNIRMLATDRTELRRWLSHFRVRAALRSVERYPLPA